jgi:hypothetical protein
MNRYEMIEQLEQYGLKHLADLSDAGVKTLYDLYFPAGFEQVDEAFDGILAEPDYIVQVKVRGRWIEQVDQNGKDRFTLEEAKEFIRPWRGQTKLVRIVLAEAHDE